MNKKELQSLLEGVRTALTGNQSKLDKNRNNKIDREDFTLLRSKKKPMAENADLLALLEHLYGVLLDEKAARLQEAPYDSGQTSDPSSFYQRNREDNDRIRMSIVRASKEEERKKKEKEEQERQRGAQMENAEYDSIFENIYNLLAEEDVGNPDHLPGYYTPPQGENMPNMFPLYIPGHTVPLGPIPIKPMPPMPGPGGGVFPGGGIIPPRPPLPECRGEGNCFFDWIYTVHWEWHPDGYWQLVPDNIDTGGGIGDGGYWRPRAWRAGDEGWADEQGMPVPTPQGWWDYFFNRRYDWPRGYTPYGETPTPADLERMREFQRREEEEELAYRRRHPR